MWDQPRGKTGNFCFCLMSLLLAMLLCGCRSGTSIHVAGEFQPDPPGGLDFGKFNQTPKPRMGCLPWPGLFSAFEIANPNALGHHAYDHQTGESEQIRGIVYTCNGGFIDIAHVRKSVDMCKYVQVRVEMALMNDWSAMDVKSLEPSIYTMRFQYPPDWKKLGPTEKRMLAHELSIRIGQRMGILILNWHELLTWFGYQSTPLISEFPSAFTWDDTGAHAFGAVMVAGRALRDSRDWDDAVTIALNEGLRELGAVSPDQTRQAVDSVEGRWWSGGKPLKRDIEIGWDGTPIIAWLAPNLTFCRNAVPHRYDLPRLDNVMGRDFHNLLRVQIDPKVWQSGAISRTIPGHPSTIDVDKDLPVILEHIRQWHIKHDGPQSLKPD